MPVMTHGGFKRMTSFCKTAVPQHIADALDAIKGNDDAVKARCMAGWLECVWLTCGRRSEEGAQRLSVWRWRVVNGTVAGYKGLTAQPRLAGYGRGGQRSRVCRGGGVFRCPGSPQHCAACKACWEVSRCGFLGACTALYLSCTALHVPQAYGISLGTMMCQRLLAGGAPGVHMYTLNLERSAGGCLTTAAGGQRLCCLPLCSCPACLPTRQCRGAPAVPAHHPNALPFAYGLVLPTSTCELPSPSCSRHIGECGAHCQAAVPG
jgi:hypothetical protein